MIADREVYGVKCPLLKGDYCIVDDCISCYYEMHPNGNNIMRKIYFCKYFNMQIGEKDELLENTMRK